MIFDVITDFIGYFLIFAGAASFVISAIGIIRFPNFFLRLHAAGVADSFALPMLLVGLICIEGATMVAAKLFLLILIVLLTAPTACHALAKAVHISKE